MSRTATRREFIQQTSALGVAWWVGSSSQGWTQEKSANEQINFACIGVGGKGASDHQDAGRHGNIVAMCDIDEATLEKAAARFPKAKKYSDYRKMLDEMGGQIDAVTVSTPDHHHAPAAIRAMKMGKHCFCQKPLTYSVEEARLLRETAQDKKLCTQMGNQGTSEGGLREAVEVIRAGAIGTVKEVHVWTNRPIWPQGLGRPSESQPIPEGVHWDEFLGPAPFRPYHEAYQPFRWRGWLDFGTGALGDMACHTANMAVMALNLFDPDTVEAESSGIVENESYPKWSVITFQFPERDGRAPVKVIWYDGGKRPDDALLEGQKMTTSGSLLVGDKGKLYSPNDYGAKYVLLPEDKFKDFKKPEPSLPRSPGHFTEFANAIKENKPELAMSNFNYAGRLTETILLGNVALRAGKKVEWDAEKMRCKNLPDFQGGIRRDYREGWSIHI